MHLRFPSFSFTPINSQHFLFATLLGIAGFTLNCYPVPFFANVQFITGNLFTVIIAVLLGPWYALWTALISASALMLVWESWHVYILFGLEAIFLGYARKRDVYALYASAIYWLFIGMPVLFVYAVFFFDISMAYLPFTLIKQGINGLIYASMASLLILALPKLWQFDGKIKDKKRRLFSSQLTYYTMLMVTVSLLMSTLVFNYVFLERQQNLLNNNLAEATNHLGIATEKYIETHKRVVENTANLISLTGDLSPDLQTRLSSIHNHYPNFSTMLIANQNANVIAASPISTFLNIKHDPELINIKDRDYFIEAFYNLRLYVSSVFIGRGLGNDAIIAISAPIYSSEQHTKQIGIIEGSLNLDKLSQIEDENINAHEQFMILVDERDQLIYSSKSLPLTKMNIFKYSTHHPYYQTKLQLININNTSSGSPEFYYNKKQLSNGWTIYVLNPFEPLLKLAEKQFINSFLVLIFSLALVLWVSKKISLLLTRHLNALANRFESVTAENLDAIDINEDTPQEVFKLYQRLMHSKDQLITNQLELEKTVTKRTFELEQANERLTELADKDPLTGLYNRRFAEKRFNDVIDFCLRSEEAITIAVLDLDYFKTINDTHGHLTGDECLRQVSALLKTKFKRDTDIVARYGGEEFILILPMTNALKIEQHLNDFRQVLSETTFANTSTLETFNVTTSIGAITANANFSRQLEHWIKIADDNLYQAKLNGRNTVVINIITE